MFAGYLNGIEAMLDAQKWDGALREASELPALAAALASVRLRCSAQQVQEWCDLWVRPANAEKDVQGPDFERLRQAILSRCVPPPGGDRVPMPALRRLQRSRHMRMLPRGFGFTPSPRLGADAADAAASCAALIDAARRWYARAACHDEVVQLNLARLAVLR